MADMSLNEHAMLAPKAEDHGHFIRVNVHESRDFQLAVPAVALRIFTVTTAIEVCKMVNHKLKLPYSRVADTAVVMVHKVHHGTDGPLRHLLHTLQDDEKPVDLHRAAMQQYRDSMSGDSDAIPPEDVVTWYFRDARSTPLDLENDVSGSDVSDDEDIGRHQPWDLAHLNEENCTRCAGFLLKQSSKDPNLWRKRFCILAGDKLWFTKKRPQRHKGQLLSASSLNLVAAKVEESHAKIPFGFELHTVERVYHFRAFGRQAKKDQLQKVQKGWISALTGQIIHSHENDMIGMAEYIICDTVGARERRLNSRILSTFKNHSDESWSDRLTLLFGSRKMRTKFLLAVHNFKEHTCSSGPLCEQWIAARIIFDEFLTTDSPNSLTDGAADSSQNESLQELHATIKERLNDDGGESARKVFDFLWEDTVRTIGVEMRTRAPSC